MSGELVTNVRNLGILMLAGVISACATSHGRVDVASRSSAEVEAYVRSHWASYAERISRFASREPQKPELVSIERVECGWHYGYSDCGITVNTRFPDGFEYRRVLLSTFDRDGHGALFETIIMIHEVRR